MARNADHALHMQLGGYAEDGGDRLVEATVLAPIAPSRDHRTPEGQLHIALSSNLACGGRSATLESLDALTA